MGSLIVEDDSMAKNHHHSPAQRICGHVGMHVFHYTGRKGQAEENRYAANSLCPECAGVIRVWFEQSEPGFYKVDLPKLVSRSPNLISWGNRVRIAQLRKLGPVMKRMASESESDPLAALTLQVLTMMFKIDSASFWVDVDKHTYGTYTLGWDLEALIRGRETPTNPLGKASVFGYWVARNERVANDAIEAAALLKPILKEYRRGLVAAEVAAST